MRSTCRSCCGVEVQAAEVGRGVGVVEPAAHGVLQRLGLLVDLLEHVVLEVALVGVAGVPVDGVDVGRRRGAGRRRGCASSSGVSTHIWWSLQVDHLVGVAGQGGRVAGQEVLAVADADHQRAAEAGADDQARVARADDGQAVGALQQRQRPCAPPRPGRRRQVAGDQLGDDFGVGVAVEDDALGLRAAA